MIKRSCRQNKGRFFKNKIMTEFKFDKLVRDEIVGSIEKGGGKVNYRTLDDSELVTQAKRKLLEEARELHNAEGEDLVSELADVSELVDVLLRALDISEQDFGLIRDKKNKKAGAFGRKHYIDTVEVDEDNEWFEYYQSQPDKYPEVKKGKLD